MDFSSLVAAMPGSLSQGVLWGMMVIGVYITFRLLDIPDMTCDGSFALGGCVSAVLIVNYEVNPIIAIVIAIIAGMLAGFITGFLHTVFEIPAILAGILTQYSLWSINLRIMSGKSNMPLLKSKTLFSGLTEMTGFKNAYVSLGVGVVFAVLLIVFLYWFFGTEIGASLRATGNNEDMIRALGVDIKKTKLLALMISNGLIALSGSLIAQSQKYADISMGTGAIVIGLASIVIGEVLLGKLKSFGSKLTSVVVGCIVYMVIRALVLWLGLDSNDMKLLSAIIVALALALPVAIEKYRIKKSYTPDGGEKAC